MYRLVIESEKCKKTKKNKLQNTPHLPNIAIINFPVRSTPNSTPNSCPKQWWPSIQNQTGLEEPLITAPGSHVTELKAERSYLTHDQRPNSDLSCDRTYQSNPLRYLERRSHPIRYSYVDLWRRSAAAKCGKIILRVALECIRHYWSTGRLITGILWPN